MHCSHRGQSEKKKFAGAKTESERGRTTKKSAPHGPARDPPFGDPTRGLVGDQGDPASVPGICQAAKKKGARSKPEVRLIVKPERVLVAHIKRPSD